MNPYEIFKSECYLEIDRMVSSPMVTRLTNEWIQTVNLHKYSYHFEWQGRPIIQYPQDIVAMQELIWLIKPDLIIETGIAHGGSLVFSASMLALLDYCEAQQNGTMLDPANPARKVLGVDIDIRAHNRTAIEAHPLFSRIEMIEGSSIEPGIINQVRRISENYQRILVCLDSNHTHDHVLSELQAYAPLVSIGSYCVVFDTIIENMPSDMFPDRLWGPGNNPKTAVLEYLKQLRQEEQCNRDGMGLRFEINRQIEHKLLITVAPDGYLRRVQ
jgi:cephalosporin hydroxylase